MRLTNTPEDESRPYINGKWVVYTNILQESSTSIFVSLHLSNLASVS